MVHLTHELYAVLDFLQSFDTVAVDLVEVVKLVLQAEYFGSFDDLGCNVIAIAIKHDFLIKLTLFGGILHEYNA